MKTLEQIYTDYNSKTIDGRDLNRLADFIPHEDLHRIGFGVVEGKTHEHIEFTRENVLEQLKRDVAFGMEKARNERGISASLMHQVVCMWNWILEEGLEDFTEYGWYGNAVFKATAEKYGFDLD